MVAPQQTQLAAWLAILTAVLAAVFSVSDAGQIEVLQPHSPLYVLTGTALELVCISSERTALEWIRQTPATVWVNSKVVPTVGSDLRLINCIEEPEGRVKSTLVKGQMELEDEGIYICREETEMESFGLYVIMLHIYAMNGTVQPDQSQVTLMCVIAGFNSNPPEMAYEWERDGQTLVNTEAEQSKYEVVLLDQYPLRMKLIINNPTYSDHGQYSCSYILATNQGPLTFTQTAYVDASSIEPRAGASAPLPAAAVLVLCASLLTFM